MHIPTPAEIRAMREKFSMTQADLAGRAGISQSMVARIEAGSVDPRVSTLQRIVAILNIAERSVITAAQVMHTPVIGVSPDDPITNAVELMERHGVSQLPVLREGVPVGCISEAALLSALEEQQLHRSHPYHVEEFMEPSFPAVPPEMDVETILHILQQHHAVLVVEAGRVQGVVTKHDLISLIV
jgi:predicted transcriptional regulator